jgi:hypothetical protein
MSTYNCLFDEIPHGQIHQSNFNLTFRFNRNMIIMLTIHRYKALNQFNTTKNLFPSINGDLRIRFSKVFPSSKELPSIINSPAIQG